MQDECQNKQVDLMNILELTLDAMPTSNKIGDTENRNNTANSDQPVIATQTRGYAQPMEPRRLTCIAARAAVNSEGSSSKASEENSYNPESKEETFRAIPDALLTIMTDTDETWVPKSYSEAMK